MVQDFYQKAIRFTGEKHFNQKMPGFEANYLVHLSNVAMEILVAYQKKNNFNVELAVQAAILHDTIEDTETTFAEVKETFGTQVATTVLALTKDKTLKTKEAQMKNSLTRINSTFKEAGIVKLADRITNLQDPPKHWSKEKIESYKTESLHILDSLRGKNEYLENRLSMKIKDYDKYLNEQNE